MRASLIRLSCLLSLLITSSASAVTIDWAIVWAGYQFDCDRQAGGCFGVVEYDYQISKYEITNAQYVEFLNAKAATDPLELYNDSFMGSSESWGGITRSGSQGSYSYGAIPGRESMPVNWVSFYDALRFANWLNNGQGDGDTETGAYTLLGGTSTPSNGATVTRNPEATIVLTSEDEWYKAAYYEPATPSGYYDFPAGSDALPECAEPNSAPNHANCDRQVFDLTAVGSYTGSQSPWGTFDQGGNVDEWNETSVNDGQGRRYRGGDFASSAIDLGARVRRSIASDVERDTRGFRIAMIPEPSTGLLVIAGLLGLAGWRRTRA